MIAKCIYLVVVFYIQLITNFNKVLQLAYHSKPVWLKVFLGTLRRNPCVFEENPWFYGFNDRTDALCIPLQVS